MVTAHRLKSTVHDNPSAELCSGNFFFYHASLDCCPLIYPLTCHANSAGGAPGASSLSPSPQSALSLIKLPSSTLKLLIIISLRDFKMLLQTMESVWGFAFVHPSVWYLLDASFCLALCLSLLNCFLRWAAVHTKQRRRSLSVSSFQDKSM